MPDWTKSMERTYEFYVVDPTTWKDVKPIRNIKSCTISRDSSAETLGSASISTTESLGECYIRVYLITVQNGIKEKHPLGTFLVQTPSFSFDGKTFDITMDAYTPLIELKEKYPDIGYYIDKGENIMEVVCTKTKDNIRAPVIFGSSDSKTEKVMNADPNETWLSYLIELLAIAKYSYALDETSRILFEPHRDTASLQPVWEYNDDNSSILYPDLSINHDLYGVPNVVEVVYSTNHGKRCCIVENNDPNSPTSIARRGRRIKQRINDPDILGDINSIKDYAKQMLKELSTVEYTAVYTHGYCPVRLGDCVRLNYTRAGLEGVKAKVIKQSINCDTSCSVTETAVYTASLIDMKYVDEEVTGDEWSE